jgi:hypothetical protein
VFSFPSFPTPVFSTVRDWLLKLGLFNLELTAYEEGHWAVILDGTIQIGAMKCLFGVAFRLETILEKENFVLSHSDVKPVFLKTIESCRGEVVKEALDEAKNKLQNITLIISDEGSELKRGGRLFQEEQPEGQKPIHLHDVTHKLDLVLKKELKSDAKWRKITKHMNNSTQQLKLSTSSHLMPPKQRQKNRMRSEVDLIEWGINTCTYLDSEKANELEKEKLSWVFDYRSDFNTYHEMAILFDMTTKEVREHGYHRETVKILKKRGARMATNRKSRSFFSKILKTIEEETKKITDNSIFPGCSEIIESIFGKFKQLEKNHASGGITSLVLSLPALVGNMSEEIVKQAMETISIDHIKGWIEENLGDTFWSQRRSSFISEKSTRARNYLETDDLLERATG